MKANRLASPASISPFKPVATPFVGNFSGCVPIGTKILVLPDQIATATAGGIQLPPEVIERQALAVTTGMIVAVGRAAFQDWADPSEAPIPGARIHMARYAGLLIDGKDNKQYRLIQDVEVAGVQT